MNILKRFSVFGLLFAFPVISASVQAEIFKCTNPEGLVFYKDTPCPVKDEEKKLNAVKDPVNGYTPPPFVQPPELVGNKKIRSNSYQPTEKSFDSEEEPKSGDMDISRNNDTRSAGGSSGNRSTSTGSDNSYNQQSTTSNGGNDNEDIIHASSAPKNRVLTVEDKRKLLNITPTFE